MKSDDRQAKKQIWSDGETGAEAVRQRQRTADRRAGRQRERSSALAHGYGEVIAD